MGKHDRVDERGRRDRRGRMRMRRVEEIRIAWIRDGIGRGRKEGEEGEMKRGKKEEVNKEYEESRRYR